jgi:hypothetical protein
MGRVEDHLGDRMRGRAVPEDLRRLVELELGFSLHDSRQTTHERFGAPHSSALLVAVDRWQFGPIAASVKFHDAQGIVDYIEFWPSDVTRRS